MKSPRRLQLSGDGDDDTTTSAQGTPAAKAETGCGGGPEETQLEESPGDAVSAGPLTTARDVEGEAGSAGPGTTPPVGLEGEAGPAGPRTTPPRRRKTKRRPSREDPEGPGGQDLLEFTVKTGRCKIGLEVLAGTLCSDFKKTAR